MEKVKMTKNSKKYGFNKGDCFDVLRNIMGDCVIIVPDSFNIIMSEKRLRSYGILKGTPQLGG